MERDENKVDDPREGTRDAEGNGRSVGEGYQYLNGAAAAATVNANAGM